MTLPPAVTDYLQALTTRSSSPAFVQVAPDGRVLAAGGDLDRYGLGADLDAATSVTDRLPFLTGFLPLQEPLYVEQLRWGQSPVIDVHAFPQGDHAWVVLLDASKGVHAQERSQQLANLNALERDRAFVEQGLLRRAQTALDLVVWAPSDDERFRVVGDLPDWFRALAPGVGRAPFDPGSWSPFLASFLDEARAFWASPSAETRLRSGPWVESSQGEDQAFEAIALRSEGTRLFVLKRLGADFARQQEQLQATRQIQLLHERLKQEVAQRDVLIHCIVHDLMGPLTSMRGCLDMLHEGGLDDETEAELLDVGLTAAGGQERMIRDILSAFQAEADQLHRFERSKGKAPDLVAVASGVTSVLRPAFLRAGVTLELEAPAPAAPVWGEVTRLERVISNLCENALRHTPRGRRVIVGVAASDRGFRLTVDDEGAGLPPEQRPHLFKKFARGKKGGKAGLGLYFCRITVERWEGSIGCDPRAGGGTRFWFELPRAT